MLLDGLIVRGKGAILVTEAGRAADEEHDLSDHVEAVVVIVGRLRAGDAVTGEDDWRRDRSRARQADDREVLLEDEPLGLAVRAGQVRRGPGGELRTAADGERLEEAAVRHVAVEAGGAE